MRQTGKPLARKAFKALDKSLGSFVDSAWDVRHRQWVACELLALSQRHGLNLGGEGVAKGGAAGNGNESTPSAKNPQCASQTVDHLGRAVTGLAPGISPNGQCAAFLNAKTSDTATTTTRSFNADPAVATMTVAEPAVEPSSVTLPNGNTVPLWPAEAELTVLGFCPNPRLLVALLGDDRKTRVSMERGGRNWRAGQKVRCKLTQGGGSPTYRPV